MQLNVDTGQPGRQIARQAEPSPPWLLGLTGVDDDPPVKRPLAPYSYTAECECPHDCLRDHENE